MTINRAPQNWPETLPTVEEIRTLLAGKQYFDNEYHPSEFVNPYGETEEEMERRTR
jgi:hypothetical protein